MANVDAYAAQIQRRPKPRAVYPNLSPVGAEMPGEAEFSIRDALNAKDRASAQISVQQHNLAKKKAKRN